MNTKLYKIDGHTIEFGTGSSSLDPWSRDYCNQINLSAMSTCDITSFCRIDGEAIYHLRSFNKERELMDALETGALASWEEFLFFYGKELDDLHGNFSEMKKSYDESKRRSDEFEKLSPAEKKEYIANWRAKRDAEIEKMRQEQKKD